MKKLLSFLIVASLGLSLFAADIFNYVPVSGKIKSYTVTDFTIASKFGTYYRTPNIKTTHTFDSFGRKIESLELTPRDTVISKISSSYDNKGFLLGQECTNANNEIIWKSIISYKGGFKDECSEYDANDILKAKIIYTYEAGTLTEETGYDGDGALVWKTIYKYNLSGKLETESLYNSDGTLDERKSYAYTEDGKIDTITYLDSFYNKTTQEVFRYAANGTLSEITTYDSNKEVSARLVIKYNESGNVSKLSEYNIANKFDTTVNELVSMKDITYVY